MDIPYVLYSDTLRFWNQLEADYNTHRVVVIKGFPLGKREAILSVMGRFGTPQKEHYGPDLDYYHVLKAQVKPLKDRIGHIITSSTHREFDMHTDNYRQTRNAKVIGLLCVQPAAQGGDNFLTTVQTLVENLPRDVVADMKIPNWPHPLSPIPLLQEDEGGYLIRYNRDTIEALADALPWRLTHRQMEVMDNIDTAAQNAQVRLRLECGEMLILDNQRFLHGRSAFETGSRRQVIRWRVNGD